MNMAAGYVIAKKTRRLDESAQRHRPEDRDLQGPHADSSGNATRFDVLQYYVRIVCGHMSNRPDYSIIFLGFHGADYEEWRLLGCYAVWLL
jgi:hypothetical protein